MTSGKRWFEDLKELDKPVHVELADGSTLNSSMVGTIIAMAPDGTTVRYTEVLYVPGLKNNLLSFCQQLKKGARINTNDDGDTEITMPVGEGHVRIGLGKDVHGVLMVEYEPTLAFAHGSGHTHEDASSNAHGHGGLKGQSASASVTYRITHMARVVRSMTRNVDKGSHPPRTFDDMLLNAGTLLRHQQHANGVSPHVTVWTSGGERTEDGPYFAKQGLPGHDAAVVVITAKRKGVAAANGLPSGEDEDDAGSKVRYATTGVRMADSTYKVTNDMIKDQPTLAKGHDITCSRMCGFQPIPHGAFSTNRQQVKGAGAALTWTGSSRCAAQPNIT
ncbi:unnamed protein product [Closterium sp. Yama58-4]|nr:unnamed protein product [Closterium sp. Yama58-4]